MLHIWLLFLALTAASAHEDTIITILPNGKLAGFPKEYGNVSLVLTPAKSTKGNAEVRLTIGANQMDLPACVTKLFALPKSEVMRARGSWYHDRKLLPPYLVIDLPQKSYPDLIHYDGHEITFNLETAELIEIEKFVVSEKSKSSQLIDVKPSEICTQKELKALKPKVVHSRGLS